MKQSLHLITMLLINRRTVKRIAPILIALGLIACESRENSSSPDFITNPPDFTQAEFRNCLDFESNVSDPETVKQFECALVSVPLNWDNSDGDSINYFVRRLKSASPSQSQLWILPGGPGIAGDLWDEGLIWAQQLPGFDIYMPDHRGTGRSSLLGCSEKEDQDPFFTDDDASEESCLNYLQMTRGQRLNDFNVTQAAKDIGMLAAQWQLNNEDIYLYGSSYGTYWAHRYLQIFPDQASGVLLDAVCDLEGCKEQNGFFSTWNQTGQELLSLCDSDLECGSRLGGNAVTFMTDLYNKLEKGHCSDLDIEREDLQFIAGLALDEGRDAQQILPAILYRLDRCAESDLAAIEHLLALIDGGDDDDSSELVLPESRGLTLNIRYSELWDNSISIKDIEDQADNSLFTGGEFPDEALPQFELQSMWPAYDLDEYHFNWAITSTPLLITNGTLDPLTPLANAKNLKAQFNAPSQQLIPIPFAGHETLSNSPDDGGDCSFHIAVQFFQNPLNELDDTCTQSIPALDFNGDTVSAQLFFGTDSYWD